MSFNKLIKVLKSEGYEFIHLALTSSTMNDAKLFIKKNNKHCVILADQQKNGKGRRGKKWISPKGNIYCSLSFENNLNIKRHFLYSLVTVISIKMALQYFNAMDIKFKWPNDIFYHNKKFAGVILETVTLEDLYNYIIVGFGINFNTSPSIPDYPTTHIKSFSDVKSTSEFLEHFFKILFKNFENINKKNYDNFIDVYKNSLMYLNKQVKIQVNESLIIKGVIKGINKDGSLLMDNGKEITSIYSGVIKQ